MASLGHVAVGLALGRAWQPRASGRATFAAMVLFTGLSMLPDADVIAFALGIPYEHAFGHRGASHAFFTAACLALVAGLLGWAIYWSGRQAVRAAVFAYVALASHGVLDALTDGGLGPALFWPFDGQRYFFPVQPLPVAPIGAAILSPWGLRVMAVELVAFLPLWLYALWPRRHAKASVA